jgi:hypothetical protein
MDQPLYIFCRSGSRARQAAAKLEKAGYTGGCVVEGGTLAWAEAGLLAHFVNQAFIWLSGFAGAGLIFAGLIDWCGMTASHIFKSFKTARKPTHPTMFLRQISDPHLAQYAYVIGCQRTGEASVIDPERDIDRYREVAAQEGLRITAVAEMHIHADSVRSAREFAAADPSVVNESDAP